ncbi:MAG: hypothetical protein SGPRY_009731, partial [Prymnesium sp.]
LLVSYEFTYAPFSGNGMLARSIARSLLSAGCSLAVLCSRPAPDVPSLSPDNPLVPPEIPPSASLLVLPVQLATADGWRRLDDQSAFTSFWDAAEGFTALVSEWMPEVVLAVDWTGAGAWRRLRKALCLDSPPKLCYLNFRVYASGASPETAGWFNEVESAALRDADLVLSLSPADQRSLTALQQGGAAASPIHVLIPPLRGDIEALALAPPRPSSGREGTGVALPSALSRALASPHSSEKEPIVFARFVERAAGRLRRLGLTPLLFGANAEPAYSLEVRRRLLAAFPEAVVIEDFMQPQALAASFSATALNFHPCRYDAYGMSIVEAAAFGAPSVMNGGASIGASQLLPAKAGGSFEISMANEEQMAQVSLTSEIRMHRQASQRRQETDNCIFLRLQDVMDILEDAARLTSVGTKARELALQWSEDAYGETLLSHLHQLIEGTQSVLRFKRRHSSGTT